MGGAAEEEMMLSCLARSEVDQHLAVEEASSCMNL
jgi:hypothetical protein